MQELCFSWKNLPIYDQIRPAIMPKSQNNTRIMIYNKNITGLKYNNFHSVANKY